MNKVFFSGLLLFATSSFASEVVLEKNGVSLTDKEIFAAASDLSDEELDEMRKNREMLRSFLEKQFDNKVMYAAVSHDLGSDETFQVLNEMNMNKFANYYYVKKKAWEKIHAIKDFKTLAKQTYHSNIKNYQKPKSYDYYHVLFVKQEGENAKEKAETLSQNLQDGKVSISDAAKHYHSVVAGTNEEGVLQNVEPKQLFEELQKAVLGMKVGDVSKVVETPMGFHIVGLKQKNATETIPYDSQIEEKIIAELKTEIYRKTNKEIREQYKGPEGLTVNADLLETVIKEILKQ